MLLDAARSAPGLVDALDHRALVCFGLVHGVLRRVHRHPTAVRERAAGSATPPPPLAATIAELADGSRCMDAICTAVDLPATRCDAELRAAGFSTVDVFR